MAIGKNIVFQFLSLLLLMPLVSRGQYDDARIDKELKQLHKRGSKCVSLFGTFCEHCDGSFYNSMYLVYDSTSVVKVKRIVFTNEGHEIKSSFDTTYECKDCACITDYASKHYDTLRRYLPQSDVTFPTYENGDTIVKMQAMSDGKQYYYGISAGDNLDYITFSLGRRINYLYNYRKECWVFISMMKNEFVR